MERLFLLADVLVNELNLVLSENKENLDFLSFDFAEINNTRLKIILSNKNTEIEYLLSTHPLDMPWAIISKTTHKGQILTRIEDWICNHKKLDAIRYEVFPNLFKELETTGRKLSKKITDDLILYYKSIILDLN